MWGPSGATKWHNNAFQTKDIARELERTLEEEEYDAEMRDLFATMQDQLEADRVQEMASAAAAARHSDLNAGATVWEPSGGSDSY